MESKRHPVNLKQYRKLNGKWQFVAVARDAYLVRRLRCQAGMWAAAVVDLKVTPHLVPGFAHRLVSVKVNVLVLERTP